MLINDDLKSQSREKEEVKRGEADICMHVVLYKLYYTTSARPSSLNQIRETT